MREIIAELEGLRSRSRLYLWVQRVSVVLAWTVGALLALIAFDFALRLPGAMRFALLVGALAALVIAIWRYLLVARKFAPTLTQIALRLERLMPGVSGRLASSVEFAVAGTDRVNPLAARSVRETQSRLTGEKLRAVMNPRHTLRDVGILLLLLLAGGGWAGMNPAAAETGLKRLLLPFGETAWPARTGVASLMHEVVGEPRVHPRGQALPLRAEVTRGDEAMRITAHYRFRTDDHWQPWQQAVLTRQGTSAVHERLIDSSADELEVSFSTFDDRTETERVRIVPPPAVRRASVTITPPSYAAEHQSTYRAQLGTGLDGRAVTSTASLIGSQVDMTIELNKPIPVPDGVDARDRWLMRTFDWAEAEVRPAFVVDPDRPNHWRLRWTLRDTTVLALALFDEYGLRNDESITFRIEAVEDQPPSVTMTEPDSDRAVLATAVIPLRAEAQDDVAVTRVSILARKQASGSSEVGEAVLWRRDRTVNEPSGRLNAEIDLGPLDLNEGDQIILRATAEDAYEVDGETHGVVESSPRRLRVISELDFSTQLRRQLNAVRQNAIRIEGQQTELQDTVEEEGVPPGVERAQAQIAERIASQREAVEEIHQQMRDNRLDDPALDQLFDQSSDLLDFAGRASARALDEMAAGADEVDIAQAQQEVREELRDLIELLDRDEDTWVITRQLEGLMREQQRLADETDRLARQTMGQSRDELSEEDLSELDRIARRQQDLREQAQQLIEDLRQRAESMEDVDPQASSGLRTAASTGEQRELDRDMEAASEQAEQNQLRGAQRSQQAASETMQRMMQDIEESNRLRAEQLLRQLASLIESIERLITVQENELMALAQAERSDDFSGRDRAMIRLNQNTQAVAAEARHAGPDARRIARALDRAGDAQGAAITALRADPIRAQDAEDAENRSLEQLREAKQLAEELEQQTQEDELRRQREELLDRYRELAEEQVALREQTLELKGIDELNRRQIVEARRQATRQDAIRTALDDLQRATDEIMDSAIFSHVHRRMDRWAREVAEQLQNGTVDLDTTDRQQWIARSLGRLIEALEEAIAPPDDFDDGEGQDGEGGAGGDQLIPPMAELRLLRGIQEEVYNQTRNLNQRDDLAEAQRRQRHRGLGEQQRELLELGRELLEQMLQQRPPGAGTPPQ